MKTLFTIILTLSFAIIYSQTDDFEQLLKNGKAEFKKEYAKQDYLLAIDYLEKAVKIKPKHAEAHYFLAYAYSRLNSKDGKGMIQMSLALTIKCSEHLEIVNRLTPKYEGESVILDPYSKLTAEWGSMAMSYWHNNMPDSAKWAFKEGKKRGGFSNFFFQTNRAALDLCSDDAILISSGDNFTFPLWYLQIAEGYRKDVSVIDISLLNTKWYPGFLSKQNIVQFDLAEAVLDTVEYSKWSDSTITINNFSWTMKPSYYNKYLLRSDLVFLSLLKENNFDRELFFTSGFNKSMQLSLSDYLLSLIVIDKLNTNNTEQLSFTKYKLEITKILSTIYLVNKNSLHELYFVDNMRHKLLEKASFYIEKGMTKEATELFEIMDKYANEKAYPFQHENSKKYSNYLRGRL